MYGIDLSRPDHPYRKRKTATPANVKDRSLHAAVRNLSAVMAQPVSEFEKKTCKLALDWLNTLQAMLLKSCAAASSIHTLEVASVTADSDCEPVPGTERTEVFVWNIRTISDTDAMKAVNSGMGGFSDRIVRMTPEQAANLFPGQIED